MKFILSWDFRVPFACLSGGGAVSSVYCIMNITVPTLRHNIARCRSCFGFRFYGYWLNTYTLYILLAVRETLLFSSRRRIRGQNFFSVFSASVFALLEVCLVNCEHRRVLTPLIKTYLLRVINHLIYLLCTFFFVYSWSRRTSAFFAVAVWFSFFLPAISPEHIPTSHDRISKRAMNDNSTTKKFSAITQISARTDVAVAW